jgi:mono/diheme cytochrome c family protein
MRLITFVIAISVGAIVALAPAPVSAQSRAAADAAGGNPATGKKLYESYSCYACHGFNGETGARVLLPGRSASLATESSFIAYLRGRANLAPIQPSTGMPNYSATTLTDTQARDIYAYIKTFKSTSPEVNDIAAFKQILSGSQKPYKP